MFVLLAGIMSRHFVSEAKIWVAIEKEECWFEEILSLTHRRAFQSQNKKEDFFPQFIWPGHKFPVGQWDAMV